MGTIYAIGNQKGGTGKSATATNLAAAWADRGLRVLMLDLDPQGNAAAMLGIEVGEETPSLAGVFEGKTDLTGARVRDVLLPGLDVVAAGAHHLLAGVEQGLVRVPARERWLHRQLAGQHDDVDVVVLDCPPGLGMLTTNALVAADELLAPINLQDVNAIDAVNELHRTVLALRAVDFDVPTPQIVKAFVDRRLDTVRGLEPQLDDLGLDLLASEIPKTVAIDKGIAEGRPLVLREAGHPGALAYRDLASELIPRTTRKAA